MKDRVSASNTDHLCVDAPSELGGATPKVTVNGQTSHGRRGAHGRNAGQQPVLGFSNEGRKAQVRQERDQLEQKQNDLDDRIRQLGAELNAAETMKQAHNRVATTEWDLIDVPGRTAALARLNTQREELLAQSDRLAAIDGMLQQISEKLKKARRGEAGAEDLIEKLKDEWSSIADTQDTTMTELIAMEDDATLVITDDDDEYLQARLADQVTTQVWRHVDGDAERLRRRLLDESRKDRETADTTRQQLERTFATFQSRWPDPNRGTTIGAYSEYLAIYDEIISDGLHTRQAKFQRQMQEWSGQDLRLLNNAYEQSRHEIEDRMEPVNRFLAAVPFGPHQERLAITMTHIPNPLVDQFRANLRTLSSDTTKPLSDEDARDRFLALRTFMTQLGWAENGSGKRADDLLDVRRHVRIGASRYDRDDREVGVYESLAGKSGGESQELAAFIVGAALRYQLGDGDQPKPRFAPVFLDEGFVKADWEYAGRAVQAWRSLGFQLIVSAPLDKVTALEPQMDAAAVITKDLDSGFSFITEFQTMENWAAADGLREVS